MKSPFARARELEEDSMGRLGLPDPLPHKCRQCERPQRLRCHIGEMHYDDGSSRVCPNWNEFLSEGEDV